MLDMYSVPHSGATHLTSTQPEMFDITCLSEMPLASRPKQKQSDGKRRRAAQALKREVKHWMPRLTLVR